MNIIVKNNFIIPGVIGETESNQTLEDYFTAIEHKFQTHYNRFLEVDNDIINLSETKLPHLKTEIEGLRTILKLQEEAIK